MKTFKRIIIVMLAVVLLAGCSRKDATDYYEPEYDNTPGLNYTANYDSTDYHQGKRDDTTPSDLVNPVDSIQKIIVTSRIRMETKDMDKTVSAIMESLSKYGGYVQTSSINQDQNQSRYRYSTIVVRVPADHYDAFLNDSSQNGNVLSIDTTTDDITTSYYDLQARLESLRLEREKVLKFYDQAANVSELLQIEQRLSEIDSEIAASEVRMKNYDLLTTYSTVTFTITEEKEYTPTTDTFGSRLLETIKDSARGFLNFLENALYFLINSFWYILLAAGRPQAEFPLSFLQGIQEEKHST